VCHLLSYNRTQGVVSALVLMQCCEFWHWDSVICYFVLQESLSNQRAKQTDTIKVSLNLASNRTDDSQNRNDDGSSDEEKMVICENVKPSDGK